LFHSEWSDGDENELGGAFKFGRFVTVVGGLVTYINMVFWISTTFIVYPNIQSFVKYSSICMFIMALMSILLFVGFGVQSDFVGAEVKGKVIYTAIPALLTYVAAGVCIAASIKDIKPAAVRQPEVTNSNTKPPSGNDEETARDADPSESKK
jgi:hypothetical protein